jgi:hypothetical protein
VKDSQGNPLSNLLISLVARSTEEALPILTRTNERGHLLFRNVEAGTYEVAVKSSLYQNPSGRLVEIEAGQTSGIRLVLQQVFGLELANQQNVGLKSLLRSSDHRRLIFRERPVIVAQSENPSKRFFENVAFRVDTNTGLGSPLDSAGGTATNFAVKEKVSGADTYILAGQIHSGQSSLWRLKNYLEYDLGERHTLQLALGYGRLAYDQPSFPLLDNPAAIADNRDYVTARGAQRILSFEISDRLSLSENLSFLVGVELNQVRSHFNHYFASPSAQVDYSPFEGTAVQFLVASKRSTRSNTMTMVDGQTINLADAVSLSTLGDESWAGRARYYQASVTQRLTEDSSVEFAGFRTHVLDAAPAFLALHPSAGGYESFRPTGALAQNSGYRFDNVTSKVSYLGATAAGFDPSTTFLIDSVALQDILRRQGYQALAAEIQAFIPSSETYVTALVKAVPGGNPVTPLDPLSDVYETSNEGINLFIRQLIPVPASMLAAIGLDFLSAYTIEALLDIRNLTNASLGTASSPLGELKLVHHPRTVRGGIAVRF